MPEFVTYILYSQIYKKTYVGYTASIIARFRSHNTLATKGYTLRYRPWVVLEIECYRTKKEAMSREKFLKSGKGREFIKNNVIPKYITIGFISA